MGINIKMNSIECDRCKLTMIGGAPYAYVPDIYLLKYDYNKKELISVISKYSLGEKIIL